MVPPNDPKKGGFKQTPPPGSTRPKTTPPAPNKPANNALPIVLIIGFLLLVGVAWLTYKSISVTRNLEQMAANGTFRRL